MMQMVLVLSSWQAPKKKLDGWVGG